MAEEMEGRSGDSGEEPDEPMMYLLSKGQLGEILGTFNDSERRMLQLRFGLEGGRSRTLEEIGKEFGVTREHIRQIEAKALELLRIERRGKLEKFLN